MQPALNMRGSSYKAGNFLLWCMRHSYAHAQCKCIYMSQSVYVSSICVCGIFRVFGKTIDAIFSMHVLSKACIHSLHLRIVHLHIRLKEFHHFYLRVTSLPVAPGGRVKCIAVKGESRPPVFKVSLGARVFSYLESAT